MSGRFATSKKINFSGERKTISNVVVRCQYCPNKGKICFLSYPILELSRIPQTPKNSLQYRTQSQSTENYRTKASLQTSNT